ncbi:MAG: NAD+ synthase [bacterium]
MKVEEPDLLRIDPDLVVPILVEFLRNEVHRAGFTRGVLGLSGGVDSAVGFALTVEALGAENVIPIIMPHRISRTRSAEDARGLAARLGCEPEEVEITAMTDAFPDFERLDKIRAGNVMARIRMTVLYDRSALHKALVIGSSNKTELLLGYGTLFGDMASAVNPVGDLYKTQLRQVGEALGVPEEILSKAPSADLWEGQTDEEELGVDYATADAVLIRLVDRRMRPERVIEEGFDEAMVRGLLRRIRVNEYKRHLPIICKLSERTIGVDWLYPRDWGT